MLAEGRGSAVGRARTWGPELLGLTVPLVAVFGRILFRDHQFAFQDASHFYYPLLERVQQEWDAGRWPLWAPEASAGMPLLGNPTAAVLYPGKLLFFLLPYPWAFRAYAIAHVVLAYAAMWVLLSGWKVSPTGRTLGALAYAFGVPVLSQTSNVIFLVGAAWLPLGFLAADRWVRGRERWALPCMVVVLALQVLGGDPEAAYVTVVCALGYAAGFGLARDPAQLRVRLLRSGAGLLMIAAVFLGLSWWSARVVHELSIVAPGSPPPWKPPVETIRFAVWSIAAAFVGWRARRSPTAREFALTAGGLIGAAVLALALTGAQLLPTLEYTGMSFRAAESEGYHDFYPYSAHPLQFLDALWPNVFGTLEGGYRSWLNALPPKPESRLWMPSVYLGGLTLILALASVGFRNGPPWRVWLSATALGSLLAALGYFGSPLLWLRCVPGWDSALGPLEPAFSWQTRQDGFLRDGDGSLYWLLASVLPGFRSFRYPPKLLVVWALAVSALAGLGWDRLVASRSRRAETIAAGLIVVGVVALAASWLGAGVLRSAFDRLAATLRSSDEPLNVARALADLRMAIGHGLLVAAFALGLLVLVRRRPALAGYVAVAGLMVDLMTANAYHVVTVPQSAFEGVPRAMEVIRDAEKANPSPGPFRIQRVGRWWPGVWTARETGRGFEEITHWERSSLRSHYNLPLHVASTFYFDTIEPVDYGLFFLPWALNPDPETARTHGLKPDQHVWYYPRRAFDLWNTRYFIVPARLVWESPARGYAAFIPRSTFLYPPPGSFDGPGGAERRARWGATDDFRVLRNEAAFPRAWIVHRARVIPPVRGLGASERSKLMQEILYAQDEFWHMPGVTVRDPRRMAWVETDRPKEVERFLSRAEPDPAESVTVTLDEPQRVEMTAVLHSPGLAVVADLFYPGWNLTVDGRPAEVLRTNRAMRGAALEAGTHRLIFRYEPGSFRLGIALSLIGFVGLGVLGVWALRGPSRNSERLSG